MVTSDGNLKKGSQDSGAPLRQAGKPNYGTELRKIFTKVLDEPLLRFYTNDIIKLRRSPRAAVRA
jgi:hypothetical protein